LAVLGLSDLLDEKDEGEEVEKVGDDSENIHIILFRFIISLEKPQVKNAWICISISSQTNLKQRSLRFSEFGSNYQSKFNCMKTEAEIVKRMKDNNGKALKKKRPVTGEEEGEAALQAQGVDAAPPRQKKDFKLKSKQALKPGKLGASLDITAIIQQARQLCCKTTTASKKEEIAQEIFGKIQGILVKLSVKRDGSKVIQACLKHAGRGVKEKLLNCLVDGDFEELAKAKYGHFVAMKMMKQSLNKFQKEKIFKVLSKNAYFLVAHSDGSKVLDKFVLHAATPNHITKLKALFA